MVFQMRSPKGIEFELFFQTQNSSLTKCFVKKESCGQLNFRNVVSNIPPREGLCLRGVLQEEACLTLRNSAFSEVI